MASREVWAEVTTEVRKAAFPFASAMVGRLYELAREDGLASLARRYRGLDEKEREDVVCDILALKLAEIVAPSTVDPRAFFLTAIERRAIDSLRAQKQRTTKAPRLADLAEQRQSASGDEDDRLALLDDRKAFRALPEADRELLLAIALGEDRDDIARRLATSRANIDQKVSRLRKKLQGSEP